MVIPNKPIGAVGRVYQEQNRVKRASKVKSSAMGSDKITLSDEAKTLQTLRKVVEDVPDIRPKAEELKVAVSSGRYNVSGEEIAASIIKYIQQKV